MIEIYTDGSATNNGGKNSIGGYGIVVYKDGEIIDAFAENNIPGATNNQMEMTAIIWAIANYGKNRDNWEDIPIVYSDSAYAVNTFTKWMYNWKANNWIKSDGSIPKNIDLIKKYDIINNDKEIILKYIKGHAGFEGNELADKLATGEITWI